MKYLYWPQIFTDIERRVLNFQVCAKFSNNQIKEPLISYDVTNKPWQRLWADIFQYQFLLIQRQFLFSTNGCIF